MIAFLLKHRISSVYLFGIMMFLQPYVVLAVSSGPTPSSGTDGIFSVFIDSMVDADTACLYDTTGAVISDHDSAGTWNITLTDYTTLIDGTYHVLFFASNPTCTTYAVDVLNGTLARDGTYVLSGHSSSSYQSFFVNCALSTSSNCAYVVDNPNQNLFNGFILFFMSMFYIIWFFKRPK